MSTILESSTSPANGHPSSDDRKHSPPAFLDLADSAARYGNNAADVTVRAMKRIEHERQRAMQRKIFEDQMRALEHRQEQELLGIPLDTQHLAVSAPTTPPRVNAVLNGGELSPGLAASLSHSSVDADVLSRAVGSASDKRKSVTYAPSVNHSPDNTVSQSFARPGGAKSMPASRRTSASEHDEELAGHLQGLSLAGERAERVSTPSGNVQPVVMANGRYLGDGVVYGNQLNAGMMLDQQLDQEMHNAMRNLPTSDEDKYNGGYQSKNADWPQFNGNRRPESLATRGDRRNVTNPTIGISPIGDLSPRNGTLSGTTTPHIQQMPHAMMQGLSSRRGSPLGLADDLAIQTARSVPATPLPGGPGSTPQLKAPGTPLSSDSQGVNALLGGHNGRNVNESPVHELHPSLSRMSSSQYDAGSITFNGSTDEAAKYGVDSTFNVNIANNTMDGQRFNGYPYENARVANGNGGSTALYHHNGARYGLGLNGRAAAVDSKMNGLHGPKHKRGDIDREFNRFAGTRLEDLTGEIATLCKDQHGCRYLQKKLEEGVPEHRDMIFRETFSHFAELMTDPFGNYLCQKLLEYATDDQRNLICESVAQDLVNISLNMHGTRAVQKMIDFLSTRRQARLCHIQIHSIIVALSLSVVVLIKDLNGNHVIQKCLNKLAPEDNQFIYNAVAANCVEVATHRHGCCVLQRCIDHASDNQRIQLVNEITYNALTLVQDPYGNYVVQYILDLNDNRFSDAVIRQFTGNVCALSVQKFSSNVIEKCIRVAEHNTRKMLIGELLNRTRLEKLLRDSYGNYCVQTALDYAEPSQRALLVEGIRPVLPLIRNTPYGKRIQNKLQREHNDTFGGGYHGQHGVRSQGIGMQMGHQAMHHGGHIEPYGIQTGLYQGGNGLHSPGSHLHGLQGHSIDSYVLQNHHNHSPGMTPPHTHAGFSGMSSFANINTFPAVGSNGSLNDHYPQAAFGYSM
ncbi:ARM repeat-containing protein [Panus rudis PR-1116 ss-1]|nr:ARM repeat-containing protein [Panus rudis PR-1116 ss-1]